MFPEQKALAVTVDLVDLVDLAIVVLLVTSHHKAAIAVFWALVVLQAVKVALVEKVVMVALAALAVKVPMVSLTRLPW